MNLIKNVVLASVLGSGMCMAQNVQSVTPAIPVDKTIEANIQKWLNKMTLEEKIGQMCEITIDVVTDFEASKKHGFTMSEAMLDTVIGKYKVGSLLNVPLRVAQKKEVWAKGNQTDTGNFHERNRYSLYLWCRPDSWNDLYS